MSVERVASRLLVAAIPGPELTLPIERALVDLAPAGLILFDRNLKTENQIRELTGALREVIPGPLMIAVDLEGGRVNRLRALDPAFRALPSGVVQAGWPAARLTAVWQAVGQALVALGFDLDFHPPVDLDASDGSNAIGDRSFGLDPQVVTRTARAILTGLEAAGVIGCLKHFPGLGETTLDTHVGLASSPLDHDLLWQRHTLPYRELADVAPMVMTAHAHYPKIDGPEPLPATYSARLLGEWLRDRIGFTGVVISDDLEMGAVADGTHPGERARRALAAGCDLAMFCQDLDAPRHARDRLAAAIEAGELPDDELGSKRQRLALLLARFPGARGRRPAYRAALQAIEAALDA